jgi:diaminopimelate epimerase
MHGCGNDFIVVDGPVELTADRVRDLCDRRRGVGADGILVIGVPDGRRWPVILHNADGSVGESCGNGARCVGRYLLDRHGGDAVVLAFSGGDVTARRDGTGIAVGLARPTEPRPIPLDGHRAYRVSVGNPHIVVFVDDPASVDLAPLAANARSRGGDANVGAARIVAPDAIVLRVDERGVGETLACGTGACAAVAASRCERDMAETVTVRVRGGELRVQQGATAFDLSGPTEYSFEGTV